MSVTVSDAMQALEALQAREAAGERVAQSVIAEAVRQAAEADLDAQHVKTWQPTDECASAGSSRPNRPPRNQAGRRPGARHRRLAAGVHMLADALFDEPVSALDPAPEPA